MTEVDDRPRFDLDGWYALGEHCRCFRRRARLEHVIEAMKYRIETLKFWEVAAGGGNEPANLIALCPTCHALYHRGTISADSIYAYKAMLVALSQAFDLEAIDRLLFLKLCPDYLVVSGDGLLLFARLIAAGLATFRPHKGGGFYHR